MTVDRRTTTRLETKVAASIWIWVAFGVYKKGMEQTSVALFSLNWQQLLFRHEQCYAFFCPLQHQS
jgi:hypothetical protein